MQPTFTPTPTPAVLIGAGDIGECGDNTYDERTAEIIKHYPDAAVFTAGDNAYEDGKAIEFQNCYDPSWGQFKDRTRPVPGNHDFHTENGAPYYAYFGAAAGEAGKGWYSYDLGGWHIVGLNSNCDAVGCREGSPQVEWLRQDLQNNAGQCTLMIWHHPLFSAISTEGGYGFVSTFWKVAREFNVDVVVNGDQHSYQRFTPLDGDGSPDPNGVREFIVATGGSGFYEWAMTDPNIEARDNQTHGVIKFNLYPGHYEWEFLPIEGGTFTDRGSDTCH
jgi:hypothetical protein